MQQIKTERRCYNVTEAAEVLGIGLELCYDMIRAGKIPSLHLGRIYRVPIVQLNAYIAGEKNK